QNRKRLKKSRKIRVKWGMNEKCKQCFRKDLSSNCKQRLRQDLFSNTIPLFDVDNIYLSSQRVLKQNRTRLKKSRKIRVNKGTYEKYKRLRKDLYSNTTPLFDVDNIYLLPHCVLAQNLTRLTKSRKIRVNRGMYEKYKQRLRL
ncbi:Unknown protein, partial [Striga hermonthica]